MTKLCLMCCRIYSFNKGCCFKDWLNMLVWIWRFFISDKFSFYSTNMSRLVKLIMATISLLDFLALILSWLFRSVSKFNLFYCSFILFIAFDFSNLAYFLAISRLNIISAREFVDSNFAIYSSISFFSAELRFAFISRY